MMHHVVCQIGPKDKYAPRIGTGAKKYVLALRRPGDTHAIRNSIDTECSRFGLTPRAVVKDLVHLGMAVFAADMGIQRTAGYDSWTRHLRLHLPVHDPARWSAAAPIVASLLRFLTGDHWELRFRALASRIAIRRPHQTRVLDASPSAVSLFSGGMDSFIGALDRLQSGENIAFVGHHGAGTTKKSQDDAYAVVSDEYPKKSMFVPFYVQPPAAEDERERTQRSRSILFLALGTLVAAGGDKPVPLFVPENGLISLNPPLTDSRLGSLSTRTTHPYVLQLYRDLLDALQIKVEVEAPYRFTTKGEMAKGVLDPDAFLKGVNVTLSCSHPDVGRYQGNSPGQHCGYCVPCIVRRAALFAAGLDEPKRYLRDVRKKPPASTTRAGQDLRAFLMAIERFEDATPARHLFDILDTGNIPPDDVSHYLGVYQRGMAELRRFLRRAKARV